MLERSVLLKCSITKLELIQIELKNILFEEHFYVDDFLISIPNIEIGLKLMKDIKHLLSKTSLILRSGAQTALN